MTSRRELFESPRPESLDTMSDEDAVRMILEDLEIPTYTLDPIIEVEYRVKEALDGMRNAIVMINGEFEPLNAPRLGYRTYPRDER